MKRSKKEAFRKNKIAKEKENNERRIKLQMRVGRVLSADFH